MIDTMNVMRYYLLIVMIASGCFSQSQTARIQTVHRDVSNEVGTETLPASYLVLNEPPDALLAQMEAKYSGDNKQWGRAWTEENSSKPIDGQLAVRLLEIACYADIVCHRVEYPLRVATLDYVKKNIGSSDVRDSLRWIRMSYKSGLPLESDGDETRDFTCILVDAMKIRMTEYANEILLSSEISENRNPIESLK